MHLDKNNKKLFRIIETDKFRLNVYKIKEYPFKYLTICINMIKQILKNNINYSKI